MGGGGGAAAQKDIPVVNVPDYPDRVLPRRGGLKSIVNAAQSKQVVGLTAPPAQDVSSSGP